MCLLIGLAQKMLKSRSWQLLGQILKNMTWCNKFRIHYLFNDVPFSLLSILIPCIILYENSCLHLLHYTWLRCINSCTEDLNHGFLANRWLVYNWFMGLGNPLEVVVHYLLIGRMTGLGYPNRFPMVSALVCVWLHIGQDLWQVMT